MPEIWGHMYSIVLWSTKGMRKRVDESDSYAAKKGAKKLVRSDCTKILEKESSN
jgi:hypothetical protein